MESQVRVYWTKNEIGSWLLEKYYRKVLEGQSRVAEIVVVYILRVDGQG